MNYCRPCVFASCAHHLFLDVNEEGAAKQNWGNLELWDPRIPHTCSLDAADEQAAKGPKAEPLDFVAIGRLLNITGTGSRKIIRHAEEHMREAAEEAELEPSYEDGPEDPDASMPPVGSLRGVFDAVKAAPEADPIHRQLQGKKER